MVSDPRLTIEALPSRLPEPGELVQVRSRRWLVEGVDLAGGDSPVVGLACADDDAQGEELRVYWDYEPDRCSYVCQGGRMTFRLPHFWGLWVVSRTGLLLVCGQYRDGPLEMERASSYEVTPSRSGMGPGTADESFAGQQVRGSRISGQAAPGAFGRYPAARRS